jgi:hypothetical protein
MTEKDRIRLDCTVCSGIQTEIGNLKKSDEKQWDMVELLQTTKASSAQMWKIIGIFILMSMAVVGFLWGTQTKSTEKIFNRIEVMDNQTAIKRDEMNIKLDLLKENVNKLTWSMDEHLKAGNGHGKAKADTK